METKAVESPHVALASVNSLGSDVTCQGVARTKLSPWSMWHKLNCFTAVTVCLSVCRPRSVGNSMFRTCSNGVNSFTSVTNNYICDSTTILALGATHCYGPFRSLLYRFLTLHKTEWATCIAYFDIKEFRILPTEGAQVYHMNLKTSSDYVPNSINQLVSFRGGQDIFWG